MDKITRYINKTSFKIADLDGENIKPSGFSCPYCKDRGIIIDGEVASQCQCMLHKSAMKKFLFANVTKTMSSFTFDNFSLSYYSSHLRVGDNGPTYRAIAEKALLGAKQFVAKYLECKSDQGLLFAGDIGSGKTFLAGAITNALLDHEKQVLFLVVPDFLDELRATYQKQGEFSEADLMNAARNAEILVLDDLGAHNYSEWTQNKIFSLINYRVNHGLPCIITTNISIEEMSGVVGARTVSRIIGSSKIYRLHVQEDIRIIKHNNKR